MPLPLVLVEIVAEHATPELTQALLRACTRATVEAECVLADERLDESRTSAVAIVSFSTPLLVRVQVGIKEDGRWLSRQLAFTAADAQNDVFTAVGFTTGTLAGRLRGGEGAPMPAKDGALAEHTPATRDDAASSRIPPTARPAAPPLTRAGPERDAPAGATRRLAARAGLALVSVAERGGVAAGPSLHGFWTYRAGASLGVSGRMLSAPRRSDGLAARIWDVGFGFGFAYDFSQRVSIDLATELRVQRWSFDLREPQSGATANGENQTLALRFGASASALLFRPAALFLAPELSWAFEGTDVRVRDQTVFRSTAPAVGASAGLELRWR